MITSPPVLSFDNTEIAFAHKTDKELKEAHFLFNSMSYPWLVKLGTRLTPWAIKSGLPVKGIIRNTIFKQFVGGETLEETTLAVQRMARYKVQVILDYGVEGMSGEASYDHARNEFIRVIHFAATQPNIPFMSVKVTGFARFALLEKLDAAMHVSGADTLVKRYHAALATLPATEQEEWERVVARFRTICEAAQEAGVGFLVDAEETWIQDPVDALTMVMMDVYNREKLVVYNTIQLYRHDRLAFLKKCGAAAVERNFLLGVKLVRGAYMEKERKRATEMGYASPIQPSKESSDQDYNEAVSFCIDHINRIGVIVASHNEYSNLLAVQLLDEKGLPHHHPHIHFSQLYGMSDNITYNLAKSGCSVSKYLPFGPIEDVIPYLMRRAQENTSVKGQTGRELALIEKELKRRRRN
ncbi:L-proline dehydrogenase [Cnuella takakiae]|uniref:L-proline dehydrogenase n=1 Tax=Cnuella takakiae TaxID=1302690 RepID=A0A1M5B331_9BACT|nr:proline dehydrogenase family protein [Cnuella takakiae]OLY93314.1 proline dehydrogenase [Cnuella takakiae]SHF36855.1 L-proline dehydrogenase [Cnuella takakiae]